MTQHTDDHVPPFDNAAHEREWLAQERAMQRERLQLDPAGDDARSRRYRLLARALREPLPDALPPDFAQQLARRVAAIPARGVASGTSFEAALMLVLATALTVATVAVVAIYGSAWLPSFTTILPTPHAPATRWLLALGGCLGVSWLLEQGQQRAQGKTS